MVEKLNRLKVKFGRQIQTTMTSIRFRKGRGLSRLYELQHGYRLPRDNDQEAPHKKANHTGKRIAKSTKSKAKKKEDDSKAKEDEYEEEEEIDKDRRRLKLDRQRQERRLRYQPILKNFGKLGKQMKNENFEVVRIPLDLNDAQFGDNQLIDLE